MKINTNNNSNSTIKVGIWLTSDPYSGGTFQYTLSILQCLTLLKKSRPLKYDFFCFSRSKKWEQFLHVNEEKYPFDFIFIKSNIFHRRLGKLLQLFDFGLTIWRNINRATLFSYGEIYNTGIDVILFPAQDIFAYETKISVVSTIHDLMHRYEGRFPEVGNSREFKNREKYYRRISKYSRVIVVDSHIGKKHVMESYGKFLKSKVIPLPYLPPPYIVEHDTGTDFSNIKQKFNLPDRYIFYPAQFWMHKNHNNLIKAIKELKDKGTIVNAAFVGSQQNNYECVTRLIKDYALEPQIKILGYVSNDDLIGLYKNCLALVMPTFFGPTNIPVVEAMFLGVPVICSNIYSMPEQVGDAALLFDPNNTDDIADKIYNIWTDEELRKRLIHNGYEKVKDQIPENHLARWEEVIAEALRA